MSNDRYPTYLEALDRIEELEAKLEESESELVLARNTSINTNKMEILHLQIENEELKQQLAEKDKAIENWQTMYKSVMQTCSNDEREIDRLNKLLAEKEKEIETLNHYNDRLAQGIYHSYGEHFILKVKQDKISFAVEKLKEVKKLFEEKYTYDVEESDFAVIYEADIDEIVDQQIKELKEGN